MCGFGFLWRGFSFGWRKQLEAVCIIMKLIEAVWFGRSGLKSNQSNKTIY